MGKSTDFQKRPIFRKRVFKLLRKVQGNECPLCGCVMNKEGKPETNPNYMTFEHVYTTAERKRGDNIKMRNLVYLACVTCNKDRADANLSYYIDKRFGLFASEKKRKIEKIINDVVRLNKTNEIRERLNALRTHCSISLDCNNMTSEVENSLSSIEAFYGSPQSDVKVFKI
jgi:hypothetical protein